jgi:cyanophycinase
MKKQRAKKEKQQQNGKQKTAESSPPPKGKLLIIGGAEDVGDRENTSANRNFVPFELLNELVPDHKASYRIEVLTTASEEPHAMGEKYIKAFERAKIRNVGIIHVGNRDEAKDPSIIKRFEDADAVFFTGGDQFRLATILGCSDIISVIHHKYKSDEHFIFGGTSAGAMAMSRIMIYRGDSSLALLKGEVKVTSGLGFLDNCIIDTHFINRGRFGRLSEAIIMNPSCIGIGLGEDTALVIRNGNEARCHGSGMVVIIDCKDIGHTNIPYVEDGVPICAENLTVHLLTKGNGYLLRERKFIPSEADMDLEKKVRAQ